MDLIEFVFIVHLKKKKKLLQNDMMNDGAHV